MGVLKKILLLSDRTTVDTDASYLGGAVTDFIGKPVLPVILRNRVEQSIRNINSVSFSEFVAFLPHT